MQVHKSINESLHRSTAFMGKAHVSYCQQTLGWHLCRSLGTESNQSPEMLVTKDDGNQKQFGKMPLVQGSGKPSDVWSLGCLLFELFTATLLYPDSDQDFAKFFSTLTGMADEVRHALPTS